MDILPVLQGLSTPVLLALGVIMSRIYSAIHQIDKRLTIVEHDIQIIMARYGDDNG